MKKMDLWCMPIIMMVTMLSFGFASCSSDDDDNIDSSILGTWEEQNYYDGIWQWTFNSNGKGSCKVVDGKISYTFSYDFSFDGKTLTISGTEDGKKYTDRYTVTISSDGKTMNWVDTDGGYKTVLKKV
ncbi:MAG: hypothetical protein K6G08_01280 [Prevotella sp.]|nr:hypothetical protein [Prevotella sp.]